MRTLVLSFVVVLAAAGACKKDDRSAGAGGSGGSAAPGSASGSPGMSAGSGSGSAATVTATAAGVVEVFVNDASVAKVTPDQIAKWPRLDTLLPEESRRLGTWATVRIAGAKTEEVKRPSSNYPDMVPALFPGPGGKPAFGMFDPVEHAQKGKPGLQADEVREIRIKISAEGRMARAPGRDRRGRGSVEDRRRDQDARRREQADGRARSSPCRASRCPATRTPRAGG